MNVAGVIGAFRVLRNPSLCLPHATVPTFNDLPIPLSLAFPPDAHGRRPDIRAVVLDKDNCFAVPHEDTIYPPYEAHFHRLRAAYPGARLLIVSNTAGTAAVDPALAQAARLSRQTGVTVLWHAAPKPGCGPEVMAHFRAHPEAGVERPDQVAVVGDRLLTDVLLAKGMGSRTVWVRDGVGGRGARGWGRLERWMAARLMGWGWEP